jgi:hypothetical protein
VRGVEPVPILVDRDGGHVVGTRARVFGLSGVSRVREEPLDPFDEFSGFGTGIDGGCPLPNDVYGDQLRSDQCSAELEALGRPAASLVSQRSLISRQSPVTPSVFSFEYSMSLSRHPAGATIVS